MRHIVHYLVICLLLCGYSYLLNAGESRTISVIVYDHWTERPLGGALAMLYHRGQEIAEAYTDEDGKALLEYTVTGIHRPEVQGSSLITGYIYPNPFVSESTVPLYLSEPQTVHVRLVSLTGHELVSRKQHLEPGSYSIQLSTGHLLPGIYFLNIMGNESKTLRLIKAGLAQGGPGRSISFQPDYTSAAHETLSRGGDGISEQSAESEYSVMVSKQRYTARSVLVDIDKDTILEFPLKRLNEVVFAATGDEGEEATTKLQVTGELFNLSIITPDTLYMHAGNYTVRCNEDFVEPLEEQIAISATDTSFVFQIESVNAMLFVGDDPEDDLLFVVDHVDGYSIYYHGVREPPGEPEKGNDGNWYETPGIRVAYLTITHADGTQSVVIFNEEYYPIRWLTDHYLISVRRRPDQEVFDPEAAAMSIYSNLSGDKEIVGSLSDPGYGPSEPLIPSTRLWNESPDDLHAHTKHPGHLPVPYSHTKQMEDTITMNISVGDLYALLTWIDGEMGIVHEYAWKFLQDYSDDFDEICQVASVEGPDQDLYIRAAIAFSAAATARAYADALTENDKQDLTDQDGWGKDMQWPFIPRPVPTLKPPTPPSLASGMLGCMLWAEFHRRRMDRSGITIPVLVCRGATAWKGMCMNDFFLSTTINCVVQCPVTLDCFIDICAPDVMNIQSVLEIQSEY